MTGTAHIYRPVSGQLAVKVRGRRLSRADLRELLGGGIQVTWNRDRGVFLLARHHLDALLAVSLGTFRTVVVDIDWRTTEVCTPQCATANPDTWWDCVCSCRAANHGGGSAGWKVVAGGAAQVLSSEISRTTTRYVGGRLERRGQHGT